MGVRPLSQSKDEGGGVSILEDRGGGVEVLSRRVGNMA